MSLPPHALPHHDGSPLYVSTAAPAMCETVRVRVRIPLEFGPVSAVRTRSNPDHEPRFTHAVPELAEGSTGSGTCETWWQAPVTVENPVHGYRFMITRGDGSSVWLNATGIHEIETLDAEDFKLVAYDAPPAWIASTVLYQIFPDRFARSTAATPGRPRTGPSLPPGPIRSTWCSQADLTSFTAATSTASSSTSTI